MITRQGVKVNMISVIMLTYNRENFVKNMIEDVLNQSYDKFEFIIIDNGSNDNTASILEEYKNKDSRIQVVTLGGESIGCARNVGVSVSRGEYIAFVDDDDRIENDYLEFLYRMINDAEADISICGTSEGDGYTRKPQCILDEKIILTGEEAVCLLLERKYIRAATPGKLYKKAVLEMWPFVENFKNEDIHTQYKYMLSAKKIVMHGLDKYYFTRHEGNVSGFTSAAQLWTKKIMSDYLVAFHNRTMFIEENAPNIYLQALYSEWSYMISMIEKISRYDIEECKGIQQKLINILRENIEEFRSMPWIKEFEIKWLECYVEK